MYSSSPRITSSLKKFSVLGKTAMFSPSELEGEVDHSFFDSDCDDGGEKKAEKESPAANERPHATLAENTKGDWSPRNDGTKKHLEPVDNIISRAETKGNGCQSEENRWNRVSSTSPVVCTSDKAISNSSDSEEEFSFRFKRSTGSFLALFADAKGDVYSPSPKESEEEALLSKHSRTKESPKKLIRNQRTRSPSPASTESSVDADSENSCSSSDGRSSSDSPTSPRPNKLSLSPAARRTRVGSAGSGDAYSVRTEESEDTVTDVSPLSSPDLSPLQSLDLNHTEAEDGSLKEQQQQSESVPSSGLSDMHQEEESSQDVDECSFCSESQLRGKLVFRSPGGRVRKNYSFSNNEVDRIDRENQRLLRELSRHSAGSRPGSTAKKKSHMGRNSPHILLSHSALNRQREQQRIERENLAFLKRLESVKPTPGLKRSEQLADYQRYARYPGAPLSPIFISAKKERSSSKTPSAGPRSASSTHHGSRGDCTSTDFGKAPVPRSKKLSAARSARC